MNSCFNVKTAAVLKPGGLLMAELASHVKPVPFQHELKAVQPASFDVTERLAIRRRLEVT